MKKFNASLALCLFAASLSFAQTEEKAPLSYTLTPNVRAACVGQTVNFTATLKNITDKPVVIDPNGLGYSGTIFVTGPRPPRPRGRRSGAGVSGTSAESWIGDPLPGYEPAYQLLGPGETFSKIFAREIERNYRNSNVEYQATYGQFIPGKYSGMAAWRGAVDSNTVKMVARNCGK